MRAGASVCSDHAASACWRRRGPPRARLRADDDHQLAGERAREGQRGREPGHGDLDPRRPDFDLFEAGEAVAEEASTAAQTGDTSGLTRDELLQLFEAGAAALLSMPSVTPVLSAQYAFLPRWEAGLRLSGGTTALFVRNQVLRRRSHGWDGTWGASLGRASFEFPVSDLKPLEVDDFVRNEIEGHFFVGRSGRVGHVWLGPKLVLTGYESAARIPITDTCRPNASLEGSAPTSRARSAARRATAGRGSPSSSPSAGSGPRRSSAAT